MDSLLILIPIALLFTIAAIGAFFWAVNSGQYDDLDRAASDILFDEDPETKPEHKNQQNPPRPDSEEESP